MKSKIKRVQSARFLNSEYPLFVSQILAIFQKYDLALLHLKKAFEKLFALLPKLAKIKEQELSNALSNLLQELDTERDTLIKAIFANLKTMGKLTLASLPPHVAVMKRFLKTFGSDISKANYRSSTKLTNDLLVDYDAKQDVKTAVEALNLKFYFDHLRTVNNRFAEMYMQRNEDDAASEKIDTRAIRIDTDKALTDLLDAFEFCSGEYEELDYQTLANELNELTGKCKSDLKARSTRGKEDKNVSKMEPIAVLSK